MSFKALVDRLGDLTDVPARASRGAAARISELIDENFEQGVDPYGRPWSPLAPATIAKGRFAPPLTDTETMRDAIKVSPMPGSGVQIESPVSYSVFHQRGTVRMPARKFLPEGKELPEDWQDAIEEEIEKAYKGKR